MSVQQILDIIQAFFDAVIAIFNKLAGKEEPTTK